MLVIIALNLLGKEGSLFQPHPLPVGQLARLSLCLYCTDTDTIHTYFVLYLDIRLDPQGTEYIHRVSVHTNIVAYIGGLGLLIHQEGSIWAQSITNIHTPFYVPDSIKSSHPASVHTRISEVCMYRFPLRSDEAHDR